MALVPRPLVNSNSSSRGRRAFSCWLRTEECRVEDLARCVPAEPLSLTDYPLASEIAGGGHVVVYVEPTTRGTMADNPHCADAHYVYANLKRLLQYFCFISISAIIFNFFLQQ